MNKQQAIKWCNNYLCCWPNSCKSRAPTGWKWNIFTTPYKRPIYNLVSVDNKETITQKETDIK